VRWGTRRNEGGVLVFQQSVEVGVAAYTANNAAMCVVEKQPVADFEAGDVRTGHSQLNNLAVGQNGGQVLLLNPQELALHGYVTPMA
jgi:hypothetical protein